MNPIAQNIEQTMERIKNAALRAGRDPGGIKLVAVSKGVDVDRINMALEAGVKCLGENRAQEFVDKYELVQGDVEWHFIGHLQKNKVKYVIDKVALIHSLDRMSLAEELDKRAKAKSLSVDALVQVNVSGEESKHGLSVGEVIPFITTVAEKYPNIRIKGLMTIAPIADDPDKVRPYFRELRMLFQSIGEREIPGVKMEWLSMGMTDDFEVAVEEGANIVRIGRAVFGPRG
ncbi:MAG: YggS family pyridoxal phosphate-dependent enzyme [Clostridia bacterium]|nr:YggS family pyridoxal phosphate-dependent enzyme [Clostridia bacterium]